MDKVRAIAKVIWEQRFWVLSVLGLIVAVVCWNSATGALDTQFSSRKTAIDTQFTNMQGLQAKSVHPNQAVNDKNQEAVSEQTQIVNAVWKSLYERQKAAVLKWPKELGDRFITEIEKLKFRDPIAMDLRSIYQNYIGKRFDGLLDIVKARKLAEGSTGGGRGGYEMYGGRGEGGGPGAAGEFEDEDYLVQWTDQDKLRTKLQFATNKPTALQIWVTQEDLWVYETLLNVIAKTNNARGATRPDNTAIHTILTLEVGSGASTGAALTGGAILMAEASAGGAGGEGPMGGEYGGRGGEMGGEYGGRGGEIGGGEYGGRGGEYMGEAGADPTAIDSALIANRYLDHATGAPVAGEDFGLEYRQLPIRMDLIMDQRWLPRLLIECANSALPIEVKQVRVNPDKSLAGFQGLGGGGSGYSASGVNLPTDPVYGQIEIRGVVFIYNEPTADPAAAPASEDGQIAAQQ